MKKLIILRGPSGSGKSTAARKLLYERSFDTSPRSAMFEADSFFMKDGKYEFDANKLPQAHAQCQKGVSDCMMIGMEMIVVSNTNMRSRDMEPYFMLANQHGYEVEVYRTPDPWDAKLFASRNVHGLTEAMIQRQIDRYQPLENEVEYHE